jgi:hypothetical protein
MQRISSKFPVALKVRAGDRALGIPTASGTYYGASQVDALRYVWLTGGTDASPIWTGHDSSPSEAALVRAVEIVAAYDASGVAQAWALGESLH